MIQEIIVYLSFLLPFCFKLFVSIKCIAKGIDLFSVKFLISLQANVSLKHKPVPISDQLPKYRRGFPPPSSGFNFFYIQFLGLLRDVEVGSTLIRKLGYLFTDRFNISGRIEYSTRSSGYAVLLFTNLNSLNVPRYEWVLHGRYNFMSTFVLSSLA